MRFLKRNVENFLFFAASAGLLGYVVLRIIRIPDVNYFEVVYSTTAVVLAAGAALALFLPRNAKRILLLVGAAFGVSLIIGGFFLNFIGIDTMQIARQALGTFRPAPPAVALKFGRPADNRSVNEIVDALRADGVEAYRSPSLRALIDAADGGLIPLLPLSGIANATTVNCNEGDQRQFPVLTSDRYGFNNEDSVYALKSDRILLVGDSFIFGRCVHQEQSIAGQLRRDGFAAISIGIDGNGPLFDLAALREYGSRLRPKTVVWFYTVGNDLADLRDREIRSRLLVNYFDPEFSQRLADRQDDVDRTWRSIWDDPAGWKKILDSYDDGAAAYLNDGAKEAETVLRRLTTALGTRGAGIASVKETADIVKIIGLILRTAKRDVESWGGTLYFAPIRGARYYRLGRLPSYTGAVLAQARAAGIPIIDIDPAIQASGDSDRYFPVTKDAPHMNSNGYALFTRAIADVLNPKSGIYVREATFGDNCANAKLEFPVVNIVRSGNATQALLGLCGGKDKCSFDIGNYLVGGDPAGGCVKDFKMTWMCIRSRRADTVYVDKNAAGTSKVTLACGNGNPSSNISPRNVVRGAGQPKDRMAVTYKSYVGIENAVAANGTPKNIEMASILGNGFVPRGGGLRYRAEVTVPGFAVRDSTLVVGIFVDGAARANAFKRVEIGRNSQDFVTVEHVFMAQESSTISLDVRVGVTPGGKVFLNGDASGARADIPQPRLIIEEYRSE